MVKEMEPGNREPKHAPLSLPFFTFQGGDRGLLLNQAQKGLEEEPKGMDPGREGNSEGRRVADKAV